MSRTIQRTHTTLKRSRWIHGLYIALLLLYTLVGGVLFQIIDGAEHDEAIKNYATRCTSTQLALQQLVTSNCTRDAGSCADVAQQAIQ